MSRILKARSTRIALVAALVLSAFGMLANPASAGGNGQPDTPKVTICHRTNSAQNPYTVNTVAQAAVDGIAGNSGNQPDHYGEHQGPAFDPAIHNQQNRGWGDIIPAIAGVHGGLNWDSYGQSIYNNGCNAPTPPPEEPEPEYPVITHTVSGDCDNIVAVVTAGPGDPGTESGYVIGLPTGEFITAFLDPGQSETYTRDATPFRGQTVSVSLQTDQGTTSKDVSVPSEETCNPTVTPGISAEAVADCANITATVNAGDGNVPVDVTVTLDGVSKPLTLQPNSSGSVDFPSENYWGQTVDIDVSTGNKGGNVQATVPSEETCNPPTPAEPGGECTALTVATVDGVNFAYSPNLVKNEGSEDVTSFVNPVWTVDGSSVDPGSDPLMLTLTHGDYSVGNHTVMFQADIDGTDEFVQCSQAFTVSETPEEPTPPPTIPPPNDPPPPPVVNDPPPEVPDQITTGEFLGSETNGINWMLYTGILMALAALAGMACLFGPRLVRQLKPERVSS